MLIYWEHCLSCWHHYEFMDAIEMCDWLSDCCLLFPELFLQLKSLYYHQSLDVEVVLQAERLGRHLNLRQILVDGGAEVVQWRSLQDDPGSPDWNIRRLWFMAFLVNIGQKELCWWGQDRSNIVLYTNDQKSRMSGGQMVTKLSAFLLSLFTETLLL